MFLCQNSLSGISEMGLCTNIELYSLSNVTTVRIQSWSRKNPQFMHSVCSASELGDLLFCFVLFFKHRGFFLSRSSLLSVSFSFEQFNSTPLISVQTVILQTPCWFQFQLTLLSSFYTFPCLDTNVVTVFLVLLVLFSFEPNIFTRDKEKDTAWKQDSQSEPHIVLVMLNCYYYFLTTVKSLLIISGSIGDTRQQQQNRVA